MRFKPRAVFCALFVVALVVALAIPGSTVLAASGLFVSASGSDANPCTASKPCATINHALAVGGAGSTILVGPGKYDEVVVVSTRANLVAQGNVTIDADGFANGILVNGSNASGSTVQGFTVEKATFEGILVQNANNVLVQGNTVTLNDQGATSSSPTGECATVQEIPGDCGEGLHLMTSTGSRVIGNSVYQNEGGILLTDEFGPTANNQIVDNHVYANVDDCGITLAGHNTSAVSSNGTKGGVYDNLVVGNVADHNGTEGQGGGILMAAGAPGSGVWGTRVIGNEASRNGLAGVVIHSHAPGQDLNDNVIIGNRLSDNGLTGNNGKPGDSDFGESGTVDILVATIQNPPNGPPTTITGTQIIGNQLSNAEYGIWTQNVQSPPTLQAANSYINIHIPVHQQ
jgi:hypothetical protein